jgi:hypothetical protein
MPIYQESGGSKNTLGSWRRILTSTPISKPDIVVLKSFNHTAIEVEEGIMKEDRLPLDVPNVSIVESI